MHSLASFWHHLDTWVQIWCVTLVGLFVTVLVTMLVQCRRVRKRIDVASEAFGRLRPSAEEERRFGRPLEAYERIRATGDELGDAHAGWWAHIEEASEKYTSPEGREGYFITRSVGELIPLDELARRFSSSIYKTVPGVLTSLGLLGTFVALLLGLNGLSMDVGAGTVSGLDNLIANLSGKFLTSIFALGLSIVFLLVEIMWCQPQLREARMRLVRALTAALPRLNSARILLDVQRESVKQSRSLANISSDVVDKFANVFRGDLAPLFAAGISSAMASQLQVELGPTLTDLRGAMEELTTTISRLEQNKQESVVGQIRELTDSLERSLRDTLSEMGRQFQAALTGSTKEEFGQLAGIIQSSAGVVEQMNANFTILQSALQTVVEEAKKSTTEQMTTGVEQTQRLNALVEGLMIRLNETANQNYTQMSSTLTTVVTDLSNRVTALSEDMVRAVSMTAERSQAAASTTIENASAMNATTQRHLNELLATLHDKSDRFDKAGDTLLAAQTILQATLDQNHKALTALGAAASEVKTYTTGLAGIQRQIEEGQKAQTQVATLSRESVSQLVKAAETHREFLNEYRSTFEQYQGVFEGLDGRIGSVLETILERLQQYNRSVEANFKYIVDSANNVMPRMAGVLKTSTDEIKEHLDELSDVLEKGTNRLAAVRPA